MAEEKHDNIADNDVTYDHIVKYTGLFGGAQTTTLLISVVKTKLAAWLLGSSGIALISMYNKVMSLINQTTNFGISFSAVKHIAELSELEDQGKVRDIIDTVRLWSLLTALLGGMVCLFLAPWISLWSFGSYDYTTEFCVLSLVVAMMAITGGELAILKGMKRLKRIAAVSVLSTLGTLLSCVPCYYFLGVRGVVLSLLISNAVILCIHLNSSSKVVSWHTSILSMKYFRQGMPMIKLGVAFLLAGMLGQGADWFIHSFILRHSNLDVLGFYNTGYFLAITLGSLMFSSVEADFFPRLSVIANDVRRMNVTVNRQIEVCVLLIVPCLIMEIIAMPLIIRVLYTAEFAQSAPMAVCAAFYLLFKAMTLPVAYLALAKGESFTYLSAEFVYDVFIAVAIPFSFTRYGLMGAGCALSLASLFDFVFIHTFYGAKYGFRFSLRPAKGYLCQFFLLALCVYASLQPVVWLRVAIYICALSLSLWISYRVLSRESDAVLLLVDKVKRKLGKR